MCWSGEASAVLAAVGITSTAYIAYKGEDKLLWVPLGYFSSMELLQAATYTVIDQCSLPLNQFLTLLGALHIAFQPLFINMTSLHFIEPEARRRFASWAYALSLLGTAVMMLKLYPFTWAGSCRLHEEPLCGSLLCSVHGSWHIAWQVPLNGIPYLNLAYYIPAFLMPVIYGSWRFTLYQFLAGPALAWLTTDNWNEWPAVWCLFSIGLLLIVTKSPVRKLMYQRRWPLWPQK